ncbi:hypothetical protein [Nocardia sp. BMG111209]|nr:hypothetical protein [Nocardia sp. BMG111209]
MELLLVLIVIPVAVATVVLRRRRSGHRSGPGFIVGNEGQRTVDDI